MWLVFQGLNFWTFYRWYLTVGECIHSQIWNNSGSDGSINVIFCEWIEQILNNCYQSVPLYRWVTLHIIKLYCDGNCWDDFKKQERNSCHITVTVNLNPCDRSCIFGLNIQKLKVYLGSFNKIFRITRNISAIYKEHSFKSFLTYAFCSK